MLEKSPAEQGLLDLRAEGLGQLGIRFAAKIHQLPHTVNGGIAQCLVFALGDKEQLIPVGLDWRVVMGRESGKAKALIVSARDQAVPIAFPLGDFETWDLQLLQSGSDVRGNLAEIFGDQAMVGRSLRGAS